MSTVVTESDLLLPFESQRVRGAYREFFKAKRNNFFATIQRFPRLWQTFQLLDGIWVREINDLHHLGATREMLPALLFIHAHLKYRIAMELAFSLCMAEAWGVLRVGIESVAYAHKIHREPHLAEVWTAKDEDKGESQKRAFRKAFEENKAKSLYPEAHGLAPLHKYWQHYSDWGSHTTLAALALRFRQAETPEEVSWHLDYFQVREFEMLVSLASLLDASRLMEHAFFNVFKTRFNLDPELLQKRNHLEHNFQTLIHSIAKKHGHKMLESILSVVSGDPDP